MSDHPMTVSLNSIVARMAERVGNDSATSSAFVEANRLRLSATALANVAASRNPMETPEAHAVRVGKLAKQLDHQITESIMRVATAHANARDDLSARIDKRANLVPDPNFAAEIRATFRALPGKAKTAMLTELVKEGRGPELAALTRAPSLVSGLSKERAAKYEDAFVSEHAADLLDERDRLDSIYTEDFDGATKAASVLVKNLRDPLWLADIERREQEAQGAADDFARAMQS